jgi:hypothetical protein
MRVFFFNIYLWKPRPESLQWPEGFTVALFLFSVFHFIWGRHGHDRMVVGFTTTCAISAYHH